MNFRPFVIFQVVLFATLIVWNVVGFAFAKAPEKQEALNVRTYAETTRR